MAVRKNIEGGKRNLRATAEDIGKNAYLADNSYLLNLTTNNGWELLTVRKGDDPILLIIISLPYTKTVIPQKGRSRVREFVKVHYKGCEYRVLNSFRAIGIKG
jgi:hypothetical protein